MDTPFSASQWEPSKPPEEWESHPSDAAVEALIQSLNQQTLAINTSPYDPTGWLDRAKTLRQLRYPELVVGDAQKAVMLCDTLLTTLDERPQGKLGYRMGFFMIFDEGDRELEQTDRRAAFVSLRTEAQHLIYSSLEFAPAFMKGRVILRQYPWLREEHLMRTDDVLDELNHDFLAGARSIGARSCCKVKRFAFGQGVGARNGEDLLGVFATRNIFRGENILWEKSRAWGCNGTDSNSLEARSSYLPLEDLPDELLWIREVVGKHAADIILRARLLICAIEDGAEHPLDHPLIARLTPSYKPDKFRPFGLDRDIRVFNRGKCNCSYELLQQFGVDIFGNLNWDTYTFFTIKSRVGNNSWTSPNTETINSLFSLFNHSCENNVEWKASPDNRTMVMMTTRDVKKGEQLLVCYDSFVVDDPLEVRRKRFWKWLNGPCQCERCTREDEEMRQSGGSSPTCSSGSSTISDWDIEDKPVFPEDSFDLNHENSLVDYHD